MGAVVVLEKKAPNSSCCFHQHLTEIIQVCTANTENRQTFKSISTPFLAKGTLDGATSVCLSLHSQMNGSSKKKLKGKKPQQLGHDRRLPHVAAPRHFHTVLPHCPPTSGLESSAHSPTGVPQSIAIETSSQITLIFSPKSC